MMFKTKIILTFSRIIFLILALFNSASIAWAQSLPPGEPITLLRIDQMIFDISTFLIRVSAVLALIFIVWSGITYMYAGEEKGKVDSAKIRLKNGVIGSLIIFGVGVILQTIAGVITGEFFCTGLWIPGVNICL